MGAKKKASLPVKSMEQTWHTADAALTIKLSGESEPGEEPTVEDVTLVVSDDEGRNISLALDIDGINEVLDILEKAREAALNFIGESLAEEEEEEDEEEEEEEEDFDQEADETDEDE